MQELNNFNFEGQPVRTMTIEGEPYFVGKDVATILGYQNGSKAIADHVDQEDKLNNELLSSLGQRGGWLINESGLYSLILSSKLPYAKKFKRWVTSEVLPSLRKHGMYANEITVERMIEDPDFAIDLLQSLKRERSERKKLEEQNRVQQQQILEMNSKASYYDLVLNCKDLVSISKIAKDFGKSAVWMNKYLADKKIQYKQGNMWLLYQKYAKQGYTSTKTATYNGNDGKPHVTMSTYWTQKGRLFIYDLLKGDGILPLIEQ